MEERKGLGEEEKEDDGPPPSLLPAGHLAGNSGGGEGREGGRWGLEQGWGSRLCRPG